MSESMALVGLDVHRERSVAAVLDPSSGEVCMERLRGEPAALVPVFLERLGRPVRAVYEAGPTGFALARAAAPRGIDLRHLAVADAQKVARGANHAKHGLRPAVVPAIKAAPGATCGAGTLVVIPVIGEPS
jgi:hypothetical protein